MVVDDKFVIVFYQFVMLRFDGDGKGDVFVGEFMIDNLVYLYVVKNEWLISINIVIFWCGQGQCQNIRFMQQCFFVWYNNEFFVWFVIVGY